MGVATVVGSVPGTQSDSARAITGGVLNGKALILPKPGYPSSARKAHVSGTVTVQILIDESGNVIRSQLVQGHPLLAAVSLEAARAAKFSPTQLCGQPVKVTGVLEYRFIAQ